MPLGVTIHEDCTKGCPNGCAFKPDLLQDMLHTWLHNGWREGPVERGYKVRGYSELVLELSCLRIQYPSAIRGVFYQASENKRNRIGYETLNGEDSAAAEIEARRTRAAFASAFGLQSHAVPLIKLDLGRPVAPFVQTE